MKPARRFVAIAAFQAAAAVCLVTSGVPVTTSGMILCRP